MRITLLALMTGLALSVFAVAEAAAAEQPYYAGLAFGQATDDELDESDIAWRLFGGYQFTETWGVEAAYVSFGEPEVGDVSIDYGGLGLYATGRWPVDERFDVFAKLGYFFWEVEARFMGIEASDDGADLTVGLGGSMKLRDNVRAEAMYERYLGISNSDVGMISIGIAYQF